MTKDGHVYTSKATREYESLIRQSFLRAGGFNFGADPVALEVTALYSIPKSMPKKDRKRIEDGEMEVYADKLADVDNICKSVMDGLQGVAYVNDKQVVVLVARKIYDKHGGAGAVRVTISDIYD